MNEVVSISPDDERLETASRWILMLDQGLGARDREALETWLAEDPKNVAEILEVAQVWDKTDELSRLAALFPKERTGHQPKYRVLRPRRMFVTVAASMVVIFAAGLLSLSHWYIPGVGIDGSDSDGILTAKTSLHFERYETAVGEQSKVLLPDGSVLVLNTNSRLTVAYSASARVLQLHRGQIHIEVAKDNFRPLSVVAGGRILQAVGTAFSVEIAEDDRIDLIVTEGKVVVGVKPADKQAQGATTNDDTPVIAPPVLVQSGANTVTAGEELKLGGKEEVAVPVSPEEIEVKLSWREGRLIFRSEPLEKALQEVERYTMVEFVLLNENLKTTAVSGRFRAGDVDALLASLELNFNIVHHRDSKGRVLLDRR